MKVAFLMAYESKPKFTGALRLFINLASYTGSPILCYKNRMDYGNDLPFIQFADLEKLTKFIMSGGFDVLVTDDYIRRMNLSLKIKEKTGVSSICYCIVYHTTCRSQFSVLKPLFPAIRYYVARLLNDQNLIIACSRNGISLLKNYFNVVTEHFVYPPVDTSVFRPDKEIKKNAFLIHLGSETCKDLDNNLLQMILSTIKERYSDKKLYLLGNKKIAEAIFSKFKNSEIIYGVPDEKLVKILNECELVIHPQKWEPFGYVVAESIACGTPVLTMNYAGPKEIIEQTNFGILANDTSDFISILKDYRGHLKNIEYDVSQSFPFNIEHSSKNFLKVLENIKK